MAGKGKAGKVEATVPEILRVIDMLEVGPVRVERKRALCPYRVVSGEGENRTELIYSYEDTVFDPGDPSSVNLAAMITAQVALNYGMFCRKIHFRGEFDGSDRRFIRQMAENTAREIYTKKFLEPNPFLTGEAARIKAVRLDSYCGAKIIFDRDQTRPGDTSWKLWSTESNRHLVLSSGGKDSLLSFGALKEADRQVYPVFVNESGRHWFTALNAYRSFRKKYLETGRVWVNSDRVFAFMLRNMPFIRPDFAGVRSDEYPIRLWTVAVFLFGALPIARRERIGRIVIGDEFDTTQRGSRRGITHYNGLYDQSRHFDNAMSRYYLQKGWHISQFSILRPLSEMLIERILVERYPDLQKDQISCHAAHIEDDRVFPCGRCEKCRRIVGMLTALGADPGKCGYTPEQVKDCLERLAEAGVHQESAGAEHLLYILSDNNKLPVPLENRKGIREHPEIMKLRFDPRRSPMVGIPADLRKPLWQIFLEHSSGAVRREKRKWREFNPLSDPEIENPYPFETWAGMGSKGKGGGHAAGTKRYIWGELTSSEAADMLKKVDIAILPVGSVEQHGPHLPLDSDAFDARYLAERIAEACSDPRPLVLPLIPYGVSYEHEEFSGTVTISNDTLAALVYEIGMSVAGNGINKLVIINGHGGNIPALNYAAQKITRDSRIFVCVDTGETSDVDIENMIETPNDIHAGEIETSTSLAVRPELVKMEKAVKSVPGFSSRYLEFTSKRGVTWYMYTKKISESGVIGDPTRASAEKGERIWQVMIAHLVALVEDLKGMSPDEIYQKRY
ncbi:MAG: creatininase family protein [Candidatus Latescibacteria bacterium]|nr:creatininase family protein [bacterium]MBD3423513.1 creatininase family protein [Candidatus Latescibacterota bacterium]